MIPASIPEVKVRVVGDGPVPARSMVDDDIGSVESIMSYVAER